MITLIVCSSQDISDQVLTFARNSNFGNDVRVITHPRLTVPYREKTQWFINYLKPTELLWGGSTYVFLPSKKLSFPLLVLALTFPQRKVIVLPDGNYFIPRNFRIWLKVLHYYTHVKGRLPLKALLPLVCAFPFIVVRLFLFRIARAIKRTSPKTLSDEL